MKRRYAAFLRKLAAVVVVSTIFAGCGVKNVSPNTTGTVGVVDPERANEHKPTGVYITVELKKKKVSVEGHYNRDGVVGSGALEFEKASEKQ